MWNWEVYICLHGICGGHRPSGRAVSIATGYALDHQVDGVKKSAGSLSNLSSMSSKLTLGPTQLPIQWILAALSPGVILQGREADHSPTISAEVKKTPFPHTISSRSA
jgi:hypothetical protein